MYAVVFGNMVMGILALFVVASCDVHVLKEISTILLAALIDWTISICKMSGVCRTVTRPHHSLALYPNHRTTTSRSLE